MGDLLMILTVAWLAGLASVLGGVLARFEGSTETRAKQEFIHGVMAFGAGALTSAVAFALVPEGIDRLGALTLALSFLGGGVTFCIVDIVLSRSGGSKAQFVAMLTDYLPEALSLGAVFSQNRKLGFLLAGFIGLQNLPEGFNSFREFVASGNRSRTALIALLLASLLGPLAAALGYLFLQDAHTVTAGIMTFAGGGILYLVFQDIAPQAVMKRHWLPPLGAVLGFLLGALGKQLMH